MITVSISINGGVIATRSATNTGKVNSDDVPNEYRVDDGRIIRHKPNDGAVKLAIKLLQGIREV
jgi:hypothetical protein